MTEERELFEQAVEGLASRSSAVAVVGLGYVGLPLVAAFLDAGFRVLGIDCDGQKIEQLRGGQSYVAAVPSETIRSAVKDGSLRLAPTLAAVTGCGATCICVPTPLAAGRTPDLSFVQTTVAEMAPHLAEQALVVLVSTTYPGTTSEIVAPLLEAAGRRIGKTCYLAYAPEREDPGNQAYRTRDLPRVVGADDDCSRQMVSTLFEGVVDRVVAVSSSAAAEATKMLENSFRAVNIALANEMKTILGALGLDVFEVIEASATKPFGFMPFYPGPGLGGHCIPIDPFYLSWRARQIGQEARFIELAGIVNTEMPGRVVAALDRALQERGQKLLGARVLVMGVAYKADVDDPRESPAFEILHQLNMLGARISYHDPHIPVAPTMRSWKLPPLSSVPLDDATLASVDAVVIVTAHTAVDHDRVLESCSLVVDTRGVTRNSPVRAQHPDRVVDA